MIRKRFPYTGKDKAKIWINNFLKKAFENPIIAASLESMDFQIVLKFRDPSFIVAINLSGKEIDVPQRSDDTTVVLSCEEFQNYLGDIALATEVCKELKVEGAKAEEFKKYMGEMVKHYINEYTSYQCSKFWI